MQKILIPWGNWYENRLETLSFPEGWKVKLCEMQRRQALAAEEVYRALEHPIDAPALSSLAQGKRSACIIMDDISRPTRGESILPYVLRILETSGVPLEQTVILMALGAHRAMTRQDMIKKVGTEAYARVQVLNHNPFAQDLVEMVDSDNGRAIQVNRHFAEAELRIAIGCIVPHTLAGFSGGAKAVIPGIGGIQTLEDNHSLAYGAGDGLSFASNTLNPENPLRRSMERMTGAFGLDFIINAVMNTEMQIAALFAGHYIKAHRAACDQAKAYYRTPLVRDADVVVLSAYPKDTEYSQIGTAFSVLGSEKEACVKPGGTIVLATAASEGGGYHSLFGPGMRLFTPHDGNIPPPELRGRDVILYSPGLQEHEIRQFFTGPLPLLFGRWEQVIAHLEAKHLAPKVAVYPMASLQIGAFA